MHIPEDNMETPTWKFEYNFTSLYKVKDLSAQSLYKIINEWSTKGSQRFSNFFKHLRYNGKPGDCNMECQFVFYCASIDLDYEDFDVCVENYRDDAETAEMVHFWLFLLYILLALCTVVTGVIVFMYCCRTRKINKDYSPLPNYIQL